jgi:hypothetical protein
LKIGKQKGMQTKYIIHRESFGNYLARTGRSCLQHPIYSVKDMQHGQCSPKEDKDRLSKGMQPAFAETKSLINV